MQVENFIQQNTLKIAFEAAKLANCAVAVWRLPNKENQNNNKNIIIDFSDEIIPKKFSLEDNKAGFVVSPFKNEGFEQTYFINADFFYTENSQNNSIEIKEKKLCKSQKEQIFFENINNFSEKSDKNPPKLTLKPYNSEIFKNLVKKAILAIKNGDFLKVIASRQQEVLFENNDSFDVMIAFDNLCKNYPNAFISLFFIPNVGSWMGASPEVLVSIDENNIFHTMALAGTQACAQAHIQGENLQSAVWTQKEIEEQALVSRYIINCFKKIRLREFEEEGPKTVQAGNLLHLRTDFWVDMKITKFPQLPSLMLELLHPTSAVCGMPKEPALAFIEENEPQNRSFYCGFLGAVNIQNQTKIFVNLRCMEVFDDKLVLYAGGGITAYSDPEKEWNETVIKCQTILNGIL